MRLRFWGVRGSVPAPGPDTNRYGGNTCCVELRTADDELVIIDMGTGAMPLGVSLMAGPLGRGQGCATVLLSHAHWDHIQGFPFFPPIFVPGNRFTIYGNAQSASMLEGILEGQMNPHFSPIYTLKNLGSSIDFAAARVSEAHQLGGLTVRARANPHGGTTALAFRIEERAQAGCDARALVYASDVGYPADGPSDDALAFYAGAHTLIHDCTYSPEERATRLERGFSSYADAAAVAVRAGVQRLVMFHYDQDHSDQQVDAHRAACRAELDRLGGADIELVAAAEQAELAI